MTYRQHVINSPIHAPSDSSLLADGVRVVVRLLKAAQNLPGAPALDWRNHSRRAQKRARAIGHTRGQDKKQALYDDLVVVTQATLGYLEASAARLKASHADVFALRAWQTGVEHFVPLIRQGVRRRVGVGP